MRTYFTGYPVSWSPYPGVFFANDARATESEQARVLLARGLLFERREDALERARELNNRLALGNASGLPDEPASVPVLYELDGIGSDSEATGIIHWFCSERCRGKFELDAPVAIGMSSSFTPNTKCEECGAKL